MAGPKVLPALVALAMVVGCGVVAETSPSGTALLPGSRRTEPAPPGSEVAAVAEARRTGRSVEVISQRSETRDVFANPDGTLTAKLRLNPIRVRRGAGWVPVDPNLRRRPDGSLMPVATTRSVVFSGGGWQPLVRLYDGRRWVELRWPASLPKPVLAKDSATYRDVLPGVDLRLRATGQGFSKVFVVRDRAAAANPALRELRFGLTTEGLRPDTFGFDDLAGNHVLGIGAPMMWDSGVKRRPGKLRITDDTLTLVPDQRLLTAQDTKFPLYIDPPFQPSRTGFALVYSGYPGNPYWGGDGESLGKVGRCPFSYDSRCNGIGIARSYFQFDGRFLIGRHVLQAEFNAFLVWSTSCSPRWVNAWGTNPVSGATTWNNQPALLADLSAHHVAAGHDSGCPARSLGWGGWDNHFYRDSDDPPIIRTVKHALARNGGTITIMVNANDESDQLAWKKFIVNGTTPYFTVTYNSYPNKPTNVKSENKDCALAPNEPYLNPYIDNDPAKGSRGPRLASTISDVDGGLVHAQFEVYSRGGSTPLWTSPAGSVAEGPSGSTIVVDVPSAYATDGAKLSYRMRGADGVDFGPWSQTCDISIDRTAPTTTPAIGSDDFAECTFESCPISGGTGRTGTFTLDRGGDADIAGFRYDLHDQPSTYAAVDSEGKATIGITPPKDGPTDLYVRGVDRAGNLGPMSRYHFFVGPATPPKAHWRLEGLTETAVVDDSPNRYDGSITLGPADWRSGRHGDALWLNGTSAGTVTIGRPVLDTSQTFSIAAWARLDRIGGYPTVLSQSGGQSAAFQLQATPDGRWGFATTDADGAAPTRVTSSTPARVGAWTHLIGMYDAGLRQTRLYVNGALVASGPKNTAWRASGGFALGRSRATDFWPGSIDEVRVYDRALTVDEMRELAGRPATEELFWPLDDGTGSTLSDASGNYRVGALEGGATWAAGTTGTGAVRLNGTTGALGIGAPVRSDNSFTVTARAVLNQAGSTTQTVLSQDGSQHSGFMLRYRGDTRKWAFLLSQVETDTSQIVTVESGEPAVAGQWVHLAGVYDAASRRIRLYVNGLPAGEAAAESRWNAAGTFRVGRGMTTASFFAGLVDDVHVWSGARTAIEIRNEFLAKPTRRTTVFTGQLGRFVNTARHHIVTTGPVPPGSHYEGSLGLMAPDDAANTVTIHSCRNGMVDYFLSLQSDCAGYTTLGPIGKLYRSPPADVGTSPVYVCAIADRTHFASHDPDCEGQEVVGPIGYSRAMAPLIGHVSPGHPSDRASSTMRVPAHYRAERSLGLVAKYAEPETTQLLSCLDGTDMFTSTDPACEGKQVLRPIGYLWTTPSATATSSAELFRCRTPSGDRYDTHDPGCEQPGHTLDRSLGFVVTEP